MTITTTTDLHPALADALTTLDTPGQRASWEAHEVPRTAWMRHPDTTPAEIETEWRRTLAQIEQSSSNRFGAWIARVPARFRDAHLSGLTAAQHLDDLRRWFDNPDALTLFIVGAPGRGKTHAAYALANASAALDAIGHCRNPQAWTVPGLLDAMRPSANDAEGVWARAKSTPLLLLDDLANARTTDWAIERMWMLADARTGENLRTVITTNAAWPDLEATWGVPTMERFRDRSVVVKFSGENHRQPAW